MMSSFLRRLRTPWLADPRQPDTGDAGTSGCRQPRPRRAEVGERQVPDPPLVELKRVGNRPRGSGGYQFLTAITAEVSACSSRVGAGRADEDCPAVEPNSLTRQGQGLPSRSSFADRN